MKTDSKLLLILAICASLVACGDDDGGSMDAPPSDAPPMDAPDSPSGCPSNGDVMVTGEITENTTWSCDSYLLRGTVFVAPSVTLTIEAGTEIFGEPSVERSALIVTRGATLVANGTATDPIVFTSGNAEGSRATGDWGGVAILGNAPINSGSDSGEGYLEGRLEGIDAADDRGLYGGNDAASSCGSLNYVRIEFAGQEFSPNNELNGLTVAGCGSGTRISYVQVHRGKDDGVEFFGGTASLDHVVISGASDDSLDFDLGWQGNAQFLVVHQFAGIGDKAIEGDNLGSDEDATPRTDPMIYNATLIGDSGTAGPLLREGARGEFRNWVVTGFGGQPFDLAAAQVDLSMEWPDEISVENSFFFGNGEFSPENSTDEESSDYNDDGGFDEEAALRDPARNNHFDIDPMITDRSETAPNYLPMSNELAGQATPPAGLDTSATYAGAFEPGGTDWSAGWTSYPRN